MRPRLLDLFCGAGGCSAGYHAAGFDVVGVDLNPQPRYPFEFIQADAIEYAAKHSQQFDAIHASPPCQHASDLRHMHKGKSYPNLIPSTRNMLTASGKPYIIENVEGADLIDPLLLCGSMFGLGAWCNDEKYHQLRRHRLFETNFFFLVHPCRHVGRPVGVYGNGGGNKSRVEAGLVNGMTGTAKERKEAMDINWMSRAELSQAIPPAYTKFIGQQLMKHLGD